MTEQPKFRAFVDFDGTLTALDVGYEFFRKFANGKAEPIVQKYRRGEITAIECLKKECDIYNEYPAPTSLVKRFIREQKITTGFREFAAFCEKQKIPLTILSAGFDFYIEPILNLNGLSHIPVICNPTIIKNGRIIPRFIYYDPKVCVACANCKGARIKEQIRPGETAIFIGDGHSDKHGAQAADIVFARSFLKEHLDKRNIPSFDYCDFHDVIRKLDQIMNHGIEPLIDSR